MTYCRHYCLLLFFLLIITQLSFGQTGNSISGSVVDEFSESIEFASVFLTSESDSLKIIDGTTTDKSGQFSFPGLPSGQYVIHIQFVGYQRVNIPVSLNNNQQLKLSEVILKNDENLLQEVEVKAFRELISRTEEGIVVDASQNLTQIGGTVADLLKNTPGVLVGQEGAVSLRGRSPQVLINGRISGMAGIGNGTNLSQIPASSVERIEIINNPSSKYSADAEGGIINIILKKNMDVGYNGAYALGVGHGSRLRVTGSGMLNYNAKKWNIGGSYDNWFTTRTRKIERHRIQYNLPSQMYLDQDRHDRRTFKTQTARLNAGFNPNEKNSFNMEAIWLFTGEDNGETLVTNSEDSVHNFNFRNSRYSNEIRRFNTLETSLNYVHSFDNSDQQLSVNYSTTYEFDREHTNITTQPLTIANAEDGASYFQRTRWNENSNMHILSLDYAQPVAQNGLFEAGYRAIFRSIRVDFQQANDRDGTLQVDQANSDIFTFRGNNHALYSQYTGWVGDKDNPRWRYSAGLRAEQVFNKGVTAINPSEYNRHYFYLFPSASLVHYADNRDMYKFTYSRRINRPELDDYNPFVDITDSLNRHSGNPYLRPELAHSLELGYAHVAGKFTLSSSAFFRYTQHVIMHYTQVFDNGVALSMPKNFGSAATYGWENIATYEPFSFWSINFNLTGYQLQINNADSSLNIQRKQFTVFSKLINNFSLWKNGRLQITGNYTSPVAVPQGKRIAVRFVDIGVQQQLFKGQGRLGLTVTDVFNTLKYGSNLSDPNFSLNSTFKLDTRAVMLIFGYTFKSDFKEKLLENRFRN